MPPGTHIPNSKLFAAIPGSVPGELVQPHRPPSSAIDRFAPIAFGGTALAASGLPAWVFARIVVSLRLIAGRIAGKLCGLSLILEFSLSTGNRAAMGLTRGVDDVSSRPFFFTRAVLAHPLVILCVVLIGAQFVGIVGMLVAIPVATTLRVVARQVVWSLRNYRILKAA